MTRIVLAQELTDAEREIRAAQTSHDGSDAARRRYALARARLAQAELRAVLFAGSDSPPSC